MKIGTKIMVTMIFVFLMAVPLISSDLGTFKQNECISLYQYCDSCTYVNITTIQFPNGNILKINEEMTKDDIDYNYTFCNTSQLGSYYYTVKGDKSGTVSTERLSFEITPSGSILTSGSSIIILGSLIVMIIVSLIFFFVALKSENKILNLFLYSFSGIGFMMVILYTIVIIQQTVYGFENILNGVETFWFVAKIGISLSFLTFGIIIFLIMLKAWKIKRGFDDD